MKIMYQTSFRLILVLLACTLLSACATSPTGRRQLMLVSEETAISSSAQAYAQEMGNMQKEGKLSTDRALIQRINTITQRLVAQAEIMRPDSSKWQWSVAVIDDPETANAWCMAGGRMAFYSGLASQVKASDAEIAQVMGHEIGHALANHTAEKMSVAMASSVGVIAVGVVSDNHGAALAGAAAAAALAVTLPNSRAAETEADQIGIELAAKAGYDPKAAVSLWTKMNSLPGGKPPQFLSTHPNPENRIKALSALVPQMEPYYKGAGTPPMQPVQIVNNTAR
jgi:predicted Zn-dependent protease